MFAQLAALMLYTVQYNDDIATEKTVQFAIGSGEVRVNNVRAND